VLTMASSFQYRSVEAVRDAMIMRKSTSDFGTGLMVLCSLYLASVKRQVRRRSLEGEGELMELYDPDITVNDRLMEYKSPERWDLVFGMRDNQVSYQHLSYR
jgi:hypothetical protein